MLSFEVLKQLNGLFGVDFQTAYPMSVATQKIGLLLCYGPENRKTPVAQISDDQIVGL